MTFKRDARKVSFSYWPEDVFKFFFSPDHGSLQQEIIGLQALESQMTTRVTALKRNRENNEFALSIRGKILSRVWAVYCVCRVFSASARVTLVVPRFSLMHPSLPVRNEFAISTAIHG